MTYYIKVFIQNYYEEFATEDEKEYLGQLLEMEIISPNEFLQEKPSLFQIRKKTKQIQQETEQLEKNYSKSNHLDIHYELSPSMAYLKELLENIENCIEQIENEKNSPIKSDEEFKRTDYADI